jgi:hypothetical protein
MRQTRTSGLLSGEWKRNAGQALQAPATARAGNGYGLSKHHRATPRLCKLQGVLFSCKGLDGEWCRSSAVTKENTLHGSSTEKQQSQTALCVKALRRRVLWLCPALARSAQPASGMPLLRRLGQSLNLSPQHPLQFSDRLLAIHCARAKESKRSQPTQSTQGKRSRFRNRCSHRQCQVVNVQDVCIWSRAASMPIEKHFASSLTGHSSFGTNDRYTHTGMKPLEDAIAVLPSLLSIKTSIPDTLKTKR